MALNDTQLQTLATAIRAETNPICVNALSIRDDVAMTNKWVNIPFHPERMEYVDGQNGAV